jgi:hypothetical protein
MLFVPWARIRKKKGHTIKSWSSCIVSSVMNTTIYCYNYYIYYSEELSLNAQSVSLNLWDIT